MAFPLLNPVSSSQSSSHLLCLLSSPFLLSYMQASLGLLTTTASWSSSRLTVTPSHLLCRIFSPTSHCWGVHVSVMCPLLHLPLPPQSESHPPRLTMPVSYVSSPDLSQNAKCIYPTILLSLASLLGCRIHISNWIFPPKPCPTYSIPHLSALQVCLSSSQA